MLFLDKPRTLSLMIAHAEHVCVPAPFAADAGAPPARPSLLQGPPLPVVWPAEFVPASQRTPSPPPTPVPAAPVVARGAGQSRPASHPPIPVGVRGWTAA